MQWLAQREHSRAELRRKLIAYAQRSERIERDQRRRAAVSAGAAVNDAGGGPCTEAAECEAGPGASVAAIEALLDWLQARRYLCDERFAESRVHARIDRFGHARIRLELAQHGVALAPDAAQRLRETEYERARALWARKYVGAANDASNRSRQSRFLAGRGFSAEVIGRVLREAARESGGSDPQSDDD